MSELDFLLHLLLDHQLEPSLTKVIRSRIKLVQKSHAIPPPLAFSTPSQPSARMIHGALQAPSMAGKIDQIPQASNLTQVAVTPAAQAAMMSRQKAITEALSGKSDEKRTSPKKF